MPQPRQKDIGWALRGGGKGQFPRNGLVGVEGTPALEAARDVFGEQLLCELGVLAREAPERQAREQLFDALVVLYH